jgi:hypothetical protein
MRSLQLPAAVVLLALSSGCGARSVGSCRSEALGICDDYTDGAADFAVLSHVRATCKGTRGSDWSPNPCDRTGALAGCHSYNPGVFGMGVDDIVTWFWPGSSLYEPPILSVGDVASTCYGTVELPDGSAVSR